jgi:hypothetical protein
VNPSRKVAEASGKLSFLHGLLFNPEDEGDIFLRNVEISPNHTVF